MSAIRLPLLCAFAGGCLSNVVLFGVWRAAEGAGDSALKQQRRSDNVVELVTAASATPSVAQPSGLVAASAADHGHDAATEAAVTPAASDPESAVPTPAGSAVSDVLTRLEAAYRERVAARAPAQASSTQELATAAAPAASAVATAEAAPAVPTQPAADVIPSIPATAEAEPRAAAPTAVAPQVAPATPAPPQVALAALAPQVAPAAFAPQVAPAAPPVEAPDSQPPTAIHYGDVNQNTYITNVREGDVYLIQMQQVAMLQYLQLLGMPSGVTAPAPHGGAAHQHGAFSSGITNPDNPWGFHFARPNLVR